MAKRQYRLALHDERGDAIRSAQYTYVSEQTPLPGLRIDLPRGTWYVHEVVATWNGDPSSRLLAVDPSYGGTLICRPQPCHDT
jgi:hypothetical protein